MQNTVAGSVSPLSQQTMSSAKTHLATKPQANEQGKENPMHPEYRLRPLVTAACLAAIVSGCGGSSSTTMDTDTRMPDGGMMPGSGTTGPVGFMAGVDRLYSSGRTITLTDDGMTMVTEDTTQTPSGWSLTVDGKTAELAGSDQGAHSQLPSSMYYKELGSDEAVAFWSEEGGGFDGDPAPEFDYLNVYGFVHSDFVSGADLSTFEPEDNIRGDFIYVVHGTPTSDMPMSGTAAYGGRVKAREWPSDAAVLSADSTTYQGDFDMTATFGASGVEVTGAFTFDDVPAGTISFTTSVSGNQLSISGLSIDEGPFAGYQDIGVRGAFFGPEAAEVGGVFEGDNPTRNKVMHGYFAGAQ